MKSQQRLWIGVIVVLVLTVGAGYGYWAYASQHMGERESMMQRRSHDSPKESGQRMGMMNMPRIHAGMSREEMKQVCGRMEDRHMSMRKMHQRNTKKLNRLVESMKKASDDAKIEAMQETLVELVKQHNKRREMTMGSMHTMMGSMMGLHRMDDEKRQRMMDRMKDCPMMQGGMGSDRVHGSTDEDPHD